MKLLKGIGFVLLLLSALLMLLLFACAWNPDLTGQIADWLYSENTEEAAPDETENAERAKEQEEQEKTENQKTENKETADQDTANKETVNKDTDAESTEGIGADSAAKDGDVSPDAGYIAPERESIFIPQEVLGKTGFQEIEGKETEIDGDEAERLEKQLDLGESGDGLVFDPLYYPYYAMLDEKGQHLYRQIYANAKVQKGVFAPIEPIAAGELKNVFSALFGDHPELFWLNTAYSCKYRKNGSCVEIALSFNRTAKKLEREYAAFESAAEKILSAASEFENDYDKERYVHDMLIRQIDYVTGAEMNQSAYSALVNGRTVCAGYARAFQYLLQQMQIPCYYCTGYAGESHAWNIVRLEDGYYNVDVTWDDSSAGSNAYFNKTDADYADTHIREDLSVYLPPCQGERYRSAEEKASEAQSGLRTIADAGFTEDDLLRSMDAYYERCGEAIAQRGCGDYSFAAVIEGEKLYEEWKAAYDSEAYQDGYMIRAMRQVGARSCHIQLTTEKLQNNCYLIVHELKLH